MAAEGFAVEADGAPAAVAQGDGHVDRAGVALQNCRDLSGGFVFLDEFAIAEGAVRSEGGEEFDSFQEVGFALGVVADEDGFGGGKVYPLLSVVAELLKLEGLEEHGRERLGW